MSNPGSSRDVVLEKSPTSPRSAQSQIPWGPCTRSIEGCSMQTDCCVDFGKQACPHPSFIKRWYALKRTLCKTLNLFVSVRRGVSWNVSKPGDYFPHPGAILKFFTSVDVYVDSFNSSYVRLYSHVLSNVILNAKIWALYRYPAILATKAQTVRRSMVKVNNTAGCLEAEGEMPYCLTNPRNSPYCRYDLHLLDI